MQHKEAQETSKEQSLNTQKAQEDELNIESESNKPIPNALTRWSIAIMILGFLLLTIPMIFFPFQAAPNVIGIQVYAQYLGLPILGIGFILLLVGLMRAGSTH